MSESSHTDKPLRSWTQELHAEAIEFARYARHDLPNERRKR